MLNGYAPSFKSSQLGTTYQVPPSCLVRCLCCRAWNWKTSVCPKPPYALTFSTLFPQMTGRKNEHMAQPPISLMVWELLGTLRKYDCYAYCLQGATNNSYIYLLSLQNKKDWKHQKISDWTDICAWLFKLHYSVVKWTL